MNSAQRNLWPKNKNVAQGRFEYSHSPDNRALTKPYPVTTYLVANYYCCNQSQIKLLTDRPSAHVQGRYPTGQILVFNVIQTCPLHHQRELRLIRKLLH